MILKLEIYFLINTFFFINVLFSNKCHKFPKKLRNSTIVKKIISSYFINKTK